MARHLPGSPRNPAPFQPAPRTPATPPARKPGPADHVDPHLGGFLSPSKFPAEIQRKPAAPQPPIVNYTPPARKPR